MEESERRQLERYFRLSCQVLIIATMCSKFKNDNLTIRSKAVWVQGQTQI